MLNFYFWFNYNNVTIRNLNKKNVLSRESTFSNNLTNK